MSSDGSVTHWIDEIKGGNQDAAQGLWEHYFARLVRLARLQIAKNSRRISDEEDVALSVFGTFCRAAEEGRFPNLSDRDSLWRLLVKMTARKSIDLNRRQSRQRRGGGTVRGESVFANNRAESCQQALADVIGNEPSPVFVAMMTEQMELLLGLLDDPQLKELALAKMEGYTNREIATRLNCSTRTIERRLKLIRAMCDEEFIL